MLKKSIQKSEITANISAKTIIVAIFFAISIGGFFSLTSLAKQTDTVNANTSVSADPQSDSNTAVADSEDIGKLNEEITQKKSKIDELTKDIEVYKQAITAKRTESLTLKNHIAILDDEIHAVELEIEKLQQEIDATTLEIENLKLDIRAQEEKIAEHKDTLEELLRILYRNDQKSVLDIILQNNSFSEYYNYSHSLISLNGELSDTVQQVKDLKTTLEEKKSELEVKIADLGNLQIDFSTKKDTLLAQKNEKK